MSGGGKGNVFGLNVPKISEVRIIPAVCFENAAKKKKSRRKSAAWR